MRICDQYTFSFDLAPSVRRGGRKEKFQRAVHGQTSAYLHSVQFTSKARDVINNMAASDVASFSHWYEATCLTAEVQQSTVHVTLRSKLKPIRDGISAKGVAVKLKAKSNDQVPKFTCAQVKGFIAWALNEFSYRGAWGDHDLYFGKRAVVHFGETSDGRLP